MTIPQLLYLAQLEDYDVARIQAWLQKNPGRAVVEKKHRLVWTVKTCMLWMLSCILSLFFGKEKGVCMAIQALNPFDAFLKGMIVGLAYVKRRILHRNLIVIGVAGSWGKTTAKETMLALAKTKYRAYATQGNNNTVMGVALTMLRLPQNAEVFVCEMDAFYEGEIALVCSIIRPRIGLLTAIGPMHLERFHNDMDALKRAQLELLQSLPQHGLGLYPQDVSLPKVSACSVVFTSFAEAYTKIGKELGINQSVVEDVIKHLPSVEHRKSIIKNGGVTVIDDAYNANPVGFRMALDMLKQLTAKQRILVTPGMIEMGNLQFEENMKVAQEAVKVCDVVIVVGETNKDALMEGAKKAKTLVWVKDLESAQVELAKYTKPGTAILFENDLGDQYF